MKILEITDRNPSLIKQLLEVWESSVRATHLFLSEDEIENIKTYVPQALKEIPHFSQRAAFLLNLRPKKYNNRLRLRFFFRRC